MTIKEAQKLGETVLFKAGIESRRIDTSLMLEVVTGRPRSWGFAHPEYELSKAQSEQFMDLLDRRRKRTPLVHLTNKREFYGLELYVDENVLTPRIETERMVEYAITYAPQNSRLIDIGTGSGALAIAIKMHRPDIEVWATDVSDAAVKVAERNAHRHAADIHFATSDLLDGIEGEFETVVTNLPYLKDDADLMPEVKKEPGIALFGGDDGLELYRKFLHQLPAHLSPYGYLFTECDPWQHEHLIIEAQRAGLKPIEETDYFILGFQKIS